MTTAHRPTFDPARGREAERGPAYHQRLLPAHQTLKYRRATQGTVGEHSTRDLKAELLRAERRAQAKKAGLQIEDDDADDDVAHLEDMTRAGPMAQIEDADARTRTDTDTNNERDGDGDGDDDYKERRKRVLDATRDVDAASESGSASDSSSADDSDEDSEDETAELMRELDKIKRERAEAAARAAEIKRREEEEQRERDIARGNPLLNGPDAGHTPAEYGVKRRWDDDVVFKNQARGTSERERGRSKEFVNDLLRSDFHKRFMSKYVR